MGWKASLPEAVASDWTKPPLLPQGAFPSYPLQILPILPLLLDFPPHTE
jgi:hypothetical protein